MDEAIEVKNAELTLASIRSDTVQAVSELNVVLTQKNQAEEELASIQKEVQSERDAIAEERRLLQADKASALLSQEHAEKARKYEEEKLATVRKQISEAMKELSRFNDWILTAKAEHQTLHAKIENLKKEEDRLKKALEELPEIDAKTKKLLKEYRELQLDVDLSIENVRSELKKVERQRDIAIEQRDTARKAQETAEIAEEASKKRREKVVQDLKIVVGRIENAHQTTFPDLRMVIQAVE